MKKNIKIYIYVKRQFSKKDYFSKRDFHLKKIESIQKFTLKNFKN